MSGKTRPTGEQIRFRSGRTGEHNLDTYMEAVEKGDRTLADLLDDLFADDTGLFRADIFEFRFNDNNLLEFRVGDFPDATSGWLLVPNGVNPQTQALAAEQAKTDAQSARDTALTYRDQAETHKEDAETARDTTLGYRDTALQHRNDAQLARDDAQSYRDTALLHRDDADTFKGAAELARDASQGYATESMGYRDTANTHRQAAESASGTAQTARDTTLTYRDQAETHKDDAETARDVTESYRDTTLTYRDQAEAHRDKAQEWATNPEDTAVETGQFSALHHAAKAAASATLANNRATDAETARDDFQGAYVGASAQPLPSGTQTGQLIFDTTNNVIKVWDGATWNPTVSTSIGGIVSQDYTATADQETFTVDGGFTTLDVFLNGVKLASTDYTLNDPDFTLTTPAPENAVVQARGYKALDATDYPTKAEIGTAAYKDTGTGPDQVPTSSGIAMVPIGGLVALANGAPAPDNSGSIKWIELTAGKSGAGEYNEGRLTSESVTGTFPLTRATAVVVGGPMDGVTVSLLNTENRYPMPGTSPGTVANDQLQGHTHYPRGGGDTGGNNFQRNGSGSVSAVDLATTGPTSDGVNGDVRVGDHTNVKHEEFTYYMRVV